MKKVKGSEYFLVELYLYFSLVMQYLLLKAFLSTQCNTAVLLQVFQFAICVTSFSGQA